jgi:hypothetical protein
MKFIKQRVYYLIVSDGGYTSYNYNYPPSFSPATNIVLEDKDGAIQVFGSELEAKIRLDEIIAEDSIHENPKYYKIVPVSITEIDRSLL